MHILVVSKILSRRKRTAGRKNSLDNRVVREIKEHHNPLQNAAFLKASAEIIGNVIPYAHCGKNNSKALSVFFGDLRLTYDLDGKLIVRKTRA